MKIVLLGNQGISNLDHFERYCQRLKINISKATTFLIEFTDTSYPDGLANALQHISQYDHIFIYSPSDICNSNKLWQWLKNTVAQVDVFIHIVENQVALKGKELLPRSRKC